ncbi:geranylgeranylglyceryl/heptaprenylglyceryl phosphate synthase [Altibacter sp. HG106]|uniref:geranylgeranylglyceryl/heptaprenylglyceryl phosphate synthase n=1 Tax=Altibacter sp. HG106 TaxID=3023937 RepID=UPI00234FCA96|nr:geranylgeranylglyceryl/heptaprenylglyceryl phosphate synthase [Altibacter sp. HG106]MDC7995219.1 geranylgeranylglyceryl/heptaprenylglyceryl phosphate synthase [Altibacter sp. HG106]
MRTQTVYNDVLKAQQNGIPLLAILIDPDKLTSRHIADFITHLPASTTHIFVGGSEVAPGATEALVAQLRAVIQQPIVLFPGDYQQITPQADALLFLSLVSGRNPEYLIEQHIKAVPALQNSNLAVIPTAYLLIDGGSPSAVARVTQTTPLPQSDIEAIVHTAKAAEYMGKKLIYLEAGSGAKDPVHPKIISAVCEAVTVPVIVGGGIRSKEQMDRAYSAGATMVVIGTALEERII